MKIKGYDVVLPRHIYGLPQFPLVERVVKPAGEPSASMATIDLALLAGAVALAWVGWKVATRR